MNSVLLEILNHSVDDRVTRVQTQIFEDFFDLCGINGARLIIIEQIKSFLRVMYFKKYSQFIEFIVGEESLSRFG